jgi:thiopeptide-type bacteriocin biosynthesis protein
MSPANVDSEPRRISFAGFFALRTPLLPFATFLEWAQGLEAPQPGDHEALARDRARLRRRLRDAFASPALREALFVASPSLDESFAFWCDAPDSERGQKVECALTRYYSRMAARPTPFGLFAGCTFGRGGPSTRLELATADGYRRHTRLDMEHVCLMVDRLLKQPERRRDLVFRPNSSLYEIGSELRYVEARLDERARFYHLVAIDPSEALAVALRRAASGASAEAVAEAVQAGMPDIDPDEARDFVDAMVESQLLVSDLAPAVTGAEPLGELVASVRASEPQLSTALAEVGGALAALDRDGIGSQASRYRDIAARLEAAAGPVDLQRLFQVDMVKPAIAATLGPEVIAAVGDLVALLHRVAVGPEADPLREFRAEFLRRYDRRAVPLNEVLDAEAGIGFQLSSVPAADESPLIADLPFTEANDESLLLHKRDKVLLRKLHQATRSGAKEVVLGEADLAELENRRRLPLPDSFAALVTLMAPSTQALDRGDFRIYLHSCGGPSGASLLGRFAHLDRAFEEQVRQYLRDEEAHRPDAIFAEVVHLPEGRVGNIISRPVLRGYEIPFLGRSGAPHERQIPVSDLLVRVRDGRVILESAKLGREIIPRLTNAHNYRKHSITTYRFLCSLAAQGVAPWLSLDWGKLQAPFLPRLSTGRFVLARARWRWDKAELSRLKACAGDAAFAAANALRRERDMPRLVSLTDGDHVLPIDFENQLSVSSFVSLVQNRDSITLEELLPGAEDLVASAAEGSFVHEIVVPFNLAPAPRPSQAALAPRQPIATRIVERCFPPCSVWLYVKVFCGAAAADRVLRDVLLPTLPLLDATSDQWHFVRYDLPKWHLRLRCHGVATQLQQELLPALMQAARRLLDDRTIWDLQIDTYQRELERYGGPEGIELAEQIFHADSRTVLGIIALLQGDEGLDARWQLCLRGMDLLLDDLGYALDGKRALVERLRLAFAQEHDVSTLMIRGLGDKFRKQRLALEVLLDPEHEHSHAYEPGLTLLRRRSTILMPTIAKLRERESQGQLTESMDDIAASLLHMHANRLLRSNQRAHELVLYDFLGRFYESKVARARRSQPRSLQR